MKRLLGGLFETTQILGAALLFGAALLLTALTVPDVVDRAGFSLESGARVFDAVMAQMRSYGTWVAGLTLLCGLLAPYMRADHGKAIAWMRILVGGGIVACVVWLIGDASETVLPGDVEFSANAASALRARADEDLTPWTALAICSALSLVLAAFQINGHPSPEE